MIGRTNTGGNGGGGGALNFHVFDNTNVPVSPKKNDIWINTDVKITGYAFSVDEPGIKILNGSVATSSSHIGADGTIVSKVAYGITGYLELPEGAKTIIVTCSDVGSTDVYHEFYDENKNSISRVLRNKGITTYPVPENAAYVRLSRYIVTSNSDSDKITVTIDDGIVQDGAVWISTGTSSPVEFNALKKNGIQVYPLSVKQYVSGAWVDKTAKSYQGGEWVPWWDGTLYDSGDTYDAFTGGWGSYAWKSDWSTKGSATFGTSGVTLSANLSSIVARPENMIDISNYSKLVIDKTSDSMGADGRAFIAVVSKSGLHDTSDFVARLDIGKKSAGTHELDISALPTGKYYVGVYLFASSGGGTYTISFDRFALK